MKKSIIFLSFFTLLMGMISCQGTKDDAVGTEDQLYGKWQNTSNKGWYRVFYSDSVEDDKTYKWGKEWNESEGVYEKDLKEHGNGWFKWKKDKNNLLEIEMMEEGWAEIPQEITLSILSDNDLSYTDAAGRSYSFKKVTN